jgi:Nif-specific regulatory protein
MPTTTERLDLLVEMNRRLATFRQLDDLLGYATMRTRELFQAEGCAVLLVDTRAGEFRFPVSSQRGGSGVSAERLQEIRFPVTQGIAGWVVANDRAVAVDDVQHDPRFYSGVDRATGTTTRSLLCAPLRTNAGMIGVVEVINPRSVSDGDLALLEALASTIAVAHEVADHTASVRAEMTELRRLQRISGVALLGIGLVLAVVAVVAHLARALPGLDVLRQPGLGAGLVVAALGGILLVRSGNVPRE